MEVRVTKTTISQMRPRTRAPTFTRRVPSGAQLAVLGVLIVIVFAAGIYVSIKALNCPLSHQCPEGSTKASDLPSRSDNAVRTTPTMEKTEEPTEIPTTLQTQIPPILPTVLPSVLPPVYRQPQRGNNQTSSGETGDSTNPPARFEDDHRAERCAQSLPDQANGHPVSHAGCN